VCLNASPDPNVGPPSRLTRIPLGPLPESMRAPGENAARAQTEMRTLAYPAIKRRGSLLLRGPSPASASWAVAIEHASMRPGRCRRQAFNIRTNIVTTTRSTSRRSFQ
jgi:hypothetical protein